MKRNILFQLTCIVFFISAISCSNTSTSQKETTSLTDSTSLQTTSLYICPMDTEVQSDKPGTCPKCGMDLEKKN